MATSDLCMLRLEGWLRQRRMVRAPLVTLALFAMLSGPATAGYSETVRSFEVHSNTLQFLRRDELPKLVLETYISAIVDAANGRTLESLGNKCFDVSLSVPIESLLPIVRARLRALPEWDARAPAKNMLLSEAVALSLSEVFPCKKSR